MTLEDDILVRGALELLDGVVLNCSACQSSTMARYTLLVRRVSWECSTDLGLELLDLVLKLLLKNCLSKRMVEKMESGVDRERSSLPSG